MLKLVAAVALAGATIPAAAVTIDVSQSVSHPDVPYYTTTQNFTLPAGFVFSSLNVFRIAADDAAVVEINGTPIFGAGIFGPGQGYFYFTPTGPSSLYSFYPNFDNGTTHATFTAPFVAGMNTITIIVNNNNAGINSGNGPLTGGPSGVDFSATVTTSVPEPAVWGLMIAGFGLTGVAARRRSTVAA